MGSNLRIKAPLPYNNYLLFGRTFFSLSLIAIKVLCILLPLTCLLFSKKSKGNRTFLLSSIVFQPHLIIFLSSVCLPMQAQSSLVSLGLSAPIVIRYQTPTYKSHIQHLSAALPNAANGNRATQWHNPGLCVPHLE